MNETLDQLARLRRTESRVVMATLVRAHGTTPQRAGAKMWVGAGGALLGAVTIGGCVDARVIGESDAVLAGRAPTILSLALGDEDAWEIGLTCGGAVDVLLEPLDLATPDRVVEAYDAVAEALRAGRSAVAVAPLTIADGAARRLVVRDDGQTSGTLGHAALDAAARDAALDVLESGASAARTLELAGASHALFFERHALPYTVVVVGATPVAMALVPIARAAGMRTIVVDGRERLASRARFPDADEIRVGMPSELVAAVPATAATAIVLVAHDYKYELPVLRHALRADVGYVGMLGSRRRGDTMRRMLRDEGLTDAELARLHSPIGLELGGRDVGEIALAIAAELVAVRHGRRGATSRQ